MESTAPDDVIKSIGDDVQKLIRSLTAYETHDDDFKRCVDFTMYNILCEKHPVPSETDARNSLDQFVTRYDYEGFPKFAETFRNSIQGYLETRANENTTKKVKWLVLECLVQLSNDVFKTGVLRTLDSRLKACEEVTLSDDFPEENKIDWFAYLQEGSEKYRLPSDDNDENSSYDSDAAVETVITKSPTLGDDLTTTTAYNELFDHFPQVSANVLDPSTNLKKTFEDEFKAQEWLLNNVQNSWWRGEPHEIDVDFSEPVALFGLRWEEKFPVNDLQFLEEYKIMRELLWVFITDDENVRCKRIAYLRKKVSVSSLIQSTTSSLINDVLNSATKYFHLRNFYEDVFLSDNVLKVPFSYQAYAAVLKDLCDAISQRIVEEENTVKEQEETYTLLTLLDNLELYLKDLNFVYDVHKDCVLTNWREEESSSCIVRFLSKVFFKLKDIESARKKKILLRIFLRTFKVYADMTDEWLTENKLYDWRNEFFIRKNENLNVYKTFPFDDAINSEQIIVAPFFTSISERLLNCSQNVEFLCKLNKMQCVKSEILQDGKLIDCIIRQFLDRLHQHRRTNDCILSASVKPNTDEEENSIVNDGDVRGEFLGNSYLVQAYSDCLTPEDFVKMNITRGSSLVRRPIWDEEEWELNLVNLDLFPVANALDQTICTLIERKEAVIAKFFKQAIVDSYKFFDHIRTLTGLLLIDMRLFCSQMNARMNKKTWGGNHAIQILLYDCVQSNKLPFGELLHFVVDSKNAICPDRNASVSVFGIMKLIDCVTLQYSTQWPMCKIFTTEIVESVYDPLFKLVLKVNLALFSVTRLRFKDLPDTLLWRCKLRKMQLLRHWVMLLLQKLRSYMMFVVPQCMGDKLIDGIVEINNFTSLQENYLAYLQKVKVMCLISPKMLEYLNRALERVWRVCDDVRDLWTKATLFQHTDIDVTRSVDLYIQCLWYLTQIFKKFVKEKQTDNPMYNLWKELHHMVKTHGSSVLEDLSLKSNQPTQNV